MAELPSYADMLATLLASTRALAVPLDADRFLEDLIEKVSAQLGVYKGACWRRVDDSEELALILPAGNPGARIAFGSGLAGQCAHTRSMIHVTDLRQADDLSDLQLVDPDRELSPGCILNLPLLAREGDILGVLQLLHERSDGFDAQDMLLAKVFAELGALALQQAQLATSTRKTSELYNEVEVAREIQRSTLPDTMPEVPGYDLHGHFQPAAYAGGDLFDAVRLENGVFLLLGDATGHGFGPALSAIQMQGMLRVAFRLGADLDSAFLHVNNQLSEDLPADRFITAFMGFLDTNTHSVHYHSAGQGPTLHFHADGNRCEWHRPSTFPVGALDRQQVMQASALHLAPGDILGLISDGLFERTDPDDAEFGTDRVASIVERAHALPMADLCRELLDAAEEFSRGRPPDDDITIVLVRRMP